MSDDSGLKHHLSFIKPSFATAMSLINPSINPLTPNDHYRGRISPLTSKVEFYIFIQQI